MSVIETLFVMDLEVLSPGTTTDYGTEVADWDSPTTRTVSGWVAQQTRDEDLQFRDAQIDTWVCYLPKGDPITGFDRVRIVATDQTLEVQGPPWPAVDADDDSESHVECTLRMVTG